MAPSLPRLPGKVQLVFCRPDFLDLLNRKQLRLPSDVRTSGFDASIFSSLLKLRREPLK